MSITKEQIYAIADALNKDGIKPTLAAVRRRLGSGSFTTISEAVNEWKLMQLSAIEMPQEALPKILDEHLHKFGSTLWAEAVNTVNRRMTQEHQAIVGQLNEKETYYKELEQLTLEYDHELEGAKAYIENLRCELEAITKRLSTGEKESIAAQQNIDREKSENKLLLQHNAEIKQELSHANKMIDKLQANLTNLISSLDTIQKQSDDTSNPAMAKKSAILQ